jgi:hypothetical protein
LAAVIDAFRDRQRLLVLLPLAVWAAMPFTLGALIGDALSTTDDPFRRLTSIGAWAWWFAALIALAVARPITLTVARLAVPAGSLAGVWAAFESDNSTLTIVGIVAALLAALSVFMPGVGDRYVDGVSYGDERRFLLRPPGPVLLVAGPVAGLATVAGVATGPLLLADERWAFGGIVTVVGFAAAYFGVRTLNQLTRRFLVFVPNGFVIHDVTVMPEPVLFTTREVAGLGPAAAETSAKDLTAQALGLALELKLTEPTELTFATGRGSSEDQTVRSLLISPTRPAAVLRVALERGLRIA